MKGKNYCYTKEGRKEVTILENEIVYTENGEKVPDNLLKGHMSHLINPFFRFPSESSFIPLENK